ncbi:MAG: prephenate dehydratase [Phycisphaerae bacterium]
MAKSKPPRKIRSQSPASRDAARPAASCEGLGYSGGNLDDLRKRIDAIDDQLVQLINERGCIAQEIGRIKLLDGTPIYSPDREHQIFARLQELNQGPFPQDVLKAVYRELMSGSFALEKPLRVSFLGPLGSYSHQASVEKFGASVEYEPVTTIAAAVNEVERSRVDFAVVPIENSTSGGVVDTLDALLELSVRICAELYLPIHHNLISRRPLADITQVYSKPEVFSQCRDWLTQTGLQSKTVAVSSTSKAVELSAADESVAALGSVLAAELYNVPIQVRNVEDSAANVTRFFVIGKKSPKPTGDDCTMLLFGTSHRSGALVRVLDAFRQNEVNLSMITSRPNKRKNWEYAFFVSADGHEHEPTFSKTLQQIEPLCTFSKVLGSFPRAANPAAGE